MRIVHVENTKAIAVPSFQEFLGRAFENKNVPILELLLTAKDLIENPNVGFLVGTERGEYLALSIIVLPATLFDQHPQVVHFYNRGSRDLRKALVKATIDFISSKGYTTFWGSNFTGNSDRAWMKVLKPDGWSVKHIGSVMQFEVE